MSGNVDAQAAQLLNQAPNFRAAGADLFGNLRAADDNDSVVHEQAHDAAEADVRRFMHRRQAASFDGSGDGGIINSRWSFVVGRWQIEFPEDPARERLTTND